MYVELVRRVIEEAIQLHVATSQKPLDEVLQEISAHIEVTSREHQSDEPDIHYDDPLCRLGYLYMHAAANATLFERVILGSHDLRLKISNASQGVLNICSMGGGPGTELLGLAKYLLNQPKLIPPRKISFTVVDNVPAWADTWTQLAEATEEELRSSVNQNGLQLPTVAPMFLPYDILNLSSYPNHTVQFNKLDIVVFNYIFSENKTKLDQALEALRELAKVTGNECVFVVIDRLERKPQFTADVVGIFESTFGMTIDCYSLGGNLDHDEQTSEMGDMLIHTLKRTPRVKFFTGIFRNPTVFWFVVKRK